MLVTLATGAAHTVGLALVFAYALALGASGLHAALRFRSFVVGVLEPPTVLASQVAYVYGFTLGLVGWRVSRMRGNATSA
jgi:hypothetical protein